MGGDRNSVDRIDPSCTAPGVNFTKLPPKAWKSDGKQKNYDVSKNCSKKKKLVAPTPNDRKGLVKPMRQKILCGAMEMRMP